MSDMTEKEILSPLYPSISTSQFKIDAENSKAYGLWMKKKAEDKDLYTDDTINKIGRWLLENLGFDSDQFLKLTTIHNIDESAREQLPRHEVLFTINNHIGNPKFLVCFVRTNDVLNVLIKDSLKSNYEDLIKKLDNNLKIVRNNIHIHKSYQQEEKSAPKFEENLFYSFCDEIWNVMLFKMKDPSVSKKEKEMISELCQFCKSNLKMELPTELFCKVITESPKTFPLNNDLENKSPITRRPRIDSSVEPLISKKVYKDCDKKTDLKPSSDSSKETFIVKNRQIIRTNLSRDDKIRFLEEFLRSVLYDHDEVTEDEIAKYVKGLYNDFLDTEMGKEFYFPKFFPSKEKIGTDISGRLMASIVKDINFDIGIPPEFEETLKSIKSKYDENGKWENHKSYTTTKADKTIRSHNEIKDFTIENCLEYKRKLVAYSNEPLDVKINLHEIIYARIITANILEFICNEF